MGTSQIDTGRGQQRQGGAERLKYGLLGPLEARRGTEPIELGGYKQRSLLALLLINPNKVVSTDTIIDEIWGSDGTSRQNALWVGVSRLRSALEPDRPARSDGTILLTQSPGYLLCVENTDTDAGRFESLASEGRSLLEHDPDASSLVLSEALALWRGHALEEFTFEPFAAAEIERLEELRLGAVEDRIDADLRSGRSRELVGELESLVHLHPFRQRLAAHQMLALHRSGRQGDALRAFGALRSRLVEELGLDPSPELISLEARILVDDPTLAELPSTRVLVGQRERGLSVRGYELRDKVSQDSTSQTYRAFQKTVGREVAIKVIRPELANDPDFIRRFESGAQLLASLEHPQIVPVIDYWREPDSAYLVMRHLEHGTLSDELTAGPMRTSAAIGILRQVGAALASAHRRGIAHGDVRPESVAVDDERNAFLGNFGVSISPPVGGEEHELEGPIRADIAALGSLVELTLAGSVADDGSTGTLDEAVVEHIVARCATGNPDDRFDDVESVLHALDTALNASLAIAHVDQDFPADVPNPYRGLRAFAERDADVFFGRERIVERLVTRLGDTSPRGRLIALVGPSGSGKSSIVRAGLVPAVRRGAIPTSNRWFVASMTPGRHPFAALERALLTVAIDPPTNLLDIVREHGIAEAVDRSIPDDSTHTLLVVDQLEELFSLASADDAFGFLTALAAVASDPHSRVKIVTTLRADFYDRPLRHATFGELLRLGTEVITPMNAEELERSIVAPAAATGVRFENGLVATILTDLAGQPTALPLLQYALTELFERRTGRIINAETYRTVGGVSAALAHRADALYEDLDDSQRTITRDIFTRLVRLDDGGAETRRVALISELGQVTHGDPSIVLETFGRHRLLTFDHDAVTRAPTVEVAHEALIDEWAPLRLWLDDARAEIDSRQRLSNLADEWVDHDRSDDFLIAGARLGRYDGWAERPPVHLTEREADFLAASQAASLTDLLAERQRVKRLRRLVGAVACALTIALIAGGVALVQRERARTETQRAQESTEDAIASAAEAESEARRAQAASAEAELATLISRSAAAIGDDPELALLLALEANARAPGLTTEAAVLDALSSSSLASRISSPPTLIDECAGQAFLPNGFDDGIVLAGIDGEMLGLDVVTGEILNYGPQPGTCAVGFRTDAIGIAGRLDSGSQIWLGPNWETELNFNQPTFPALVTDDRLVTVSFGASVSVSLIDSETGEPIGESIIGAAWNSAASNADESLLALTFGTSNADESGTVVVVDAVTAEELSRVDVFDAGAVAGFDPVSGELVVGQRNAITTFDPVTGGSLSELNVDAATGFRAIGFRPDGRLVLVSQGAITLVDRASGDTAIAVELSNVREAVVRPDGLIVTVDDQQNVAAYDLDASALIEQSWDVDAISGVAMLDGRAAVVDRAGEELEIVDLATGEREPIELRTPDGARFGTKLMYPEPDGVWAVSDQLELARWEGDEMVDTLQLGSSASVAWRPYGNKPSGTRFENRYAVIGEQPGGSREGILVDLRRGEPSVVFRVDNTDAVWAHPSPDGGMYLIDFDGELQEFDQAGEPVGPPVATGAVEPYALTLSADGTTLALGGLDDLREPTVNIVDLTTGESHVVPVGGLVSAMGTTPDGSQVVLAMFDGSVRLYDTEQRTVPTILWNGSGAFDSEPGWYDEANSSMWMNSGGQLLQIPLDPQRWIERSCQIVGRKLTLDEWERLVPGDEPLRSVCL